MTIDHLATTTVPTPTARAAAHPLAAAGLTRRGCLKALAATTALAVPAISASAAGSPPPGRWWLTLFTGSAGGPVFWLTRGTEFIVVDGVATPVRGRIGAIAAMARPRDGGNVRVSYLLQGCTVTATGFDFVPRLVHPITGEESSTAVTPPLQLGWMLATDGQLTEDLVAANGTRATYRGSTWESPGTGDERSATVAMNIRLDRPTGEVETFTEISKSRPRPAATPGRAAPAGASDSFIAAESETFTTRELPDKAKYKGRSVMSMSMNHGTSHPGVDELRRVMRPAEASALTAFFEQLPGWVRDR